jgi:hypothetical protein
MPRRVHGFAAKEFTDAGAQHGATIAHAGVGRQAAALELQLRALRPSAVINFAEQQGASVAQLPGPVAELVTAVDAGQGRATGQGQIAG